MPAVLLLLALTLSGCLGAGSGGGISMLPKEDGANFQIAGQAYFGDRHLFGGIAIVAKDATQKPIATTYTQKDGKFYFTGLPSGIYNLTAVTGDSETLFKVGVQVLNDQPVQIEKTDLLSVSSAYFDRVTSSSMRLKFESSAPAASQIIYGSSIIKITVSPNPTTSHEITLTGLSANTYYDFTIFLKNLSGQEAVYSGIGMTTVSNSPTNISITINNGICETHIPNVTVYLRASNATQMKVGQKPDLSDATVESYATSKDIVLSGTDGIKTVYAQFIDGANLTPIVHDSIRLATSKEGYLGIWIENGAQTVNKTDVLLTLLYPGATHMQIANDSDFANVYWEPYFMYRSWKLKPPDGTKTVYARFSGGEADASLIFKASTILSTYVEPASGTASGTVPPASTPVEIDTPAEMVIWRQLSASTEEVVSGKTLSMMLEGDSVSLKAAVIASGTLNDPNGPTIYENSPIWFVNNVQGGNDIYGTIDSSTGVYKTPNQRPAIDRIEIKAVSQKTYTENGVTSTRSQSVFINLQDFWKPRKTNMQNIAGTDMPIYTLLVDPIWQPNNDYYLFAGTNGYGVWWAKVPSTVNDDAATFTWQPTVLASKNLVNPAHFIVNQLAINVENGDIAAATEDGVYIFGNQIRDYSGSSYIKLASEAAKGVAWDRKDTKYLYVTREDGIERIVNPYDPSPTHDLLYLRSYRDWEKRTDTNASPTVDIYAYSYDIKYLYTAPFRALALSFSDPNRLYFGNDNGEMGLFTAVRTTSSPLVAFANSPIFAAADGVSTYLGDGHYKAEWVTGHPRSRIQGIITDISIDPNSGWTLLAATSNGLYRSLDAGANFTSIANNVNTRGVLIDPTNVTYFFYGAENGLYRSKDSGATWAKISSGLGGQQTINCFTLSEGPPGSKRRIWVGTTGGVYMGAKSLDLY